MEQVVLHADCVYSRAFEYVGFDISVKLIGCAAIVLPGTACGIVDAKLIVREIFLRQLKTPLHVLMRIVKCRFSLVRLLKCVF